MASKRKSRSKHPTLAAMRDGYARSERMLEVWRKRRGETQSEAELRHRYGNAFADPRPTETAEYKRQLAALKDPETGPALIRDALDNTMGGVVDNAQKFGLSGQSVFTAPYGVFLDPVETTLHKLKELFK
jgi:hypothetical protein